MRGFSTIASFGFNNFHSSASSLTLNSPDLGLCINDCHTWYKEYEVKNWCSSIGIESVFLYSHSCPYLVVRMDKYIYCISLVVKWSKKILSNWRVSEIREVK